jgi:hypothetical protein
MAFLLKNSKKKALLSNSGAVALFPFIAIGLILFLFLYNGRSTAPTIDVPTVFDTQQPEPITITLVGDIMLDRGVRASVEKNFSGDYSAVFKNTSYLADADIAFANLEGPVAAETTKRLASRMLFRMDPDATLAIAESGIDVIDRCYLVC